MLDLSSLFEGCHIPTKDQHQQQLAQWIEPAPSTETVPMEVDSEASLQLLPTDPNSDSSTSQQASQLQDQSPPEVMESQQTTTNGKARLLSFFVNRVSWHF